MSRVFLDICAYLCDYNTNGITRSVERIGLLIGDRIKFLREKNNESQAELAQHIGVAQSSIGNYERGIRIPDAETIVKLAVHFWVSTDYLLCVTDRREDVRAKKTSIGLDEQAIEKLIDWNENSPFNGKKILSALSKLILHSESLSLLRDIDLLVQYSSYSIDEDNLAAIEKLEPAIHEYGFTAVDFESYVELLIGRASVRFSEILKSIAENTPKE
jgi:transcriptional regulator with XRE-family HTH domain